MINFSHKKKFTSINFKEICYEKINCPAAFAFCSFSYSQIKCFESDYVEMLKKDIQENSRQIVADNLTLTEEQAKIFWPLYDDYDAAYDKMVDERVNVIEEYMMNYYGMDEETGKA